VKSEYTTYLVKTKEHTVTGDAIEKELKEFNRVRKMVVELYNKLVASKNKHDSLSQEINEQYKRISETYDYLYKVSYLIHLDHPILNGVATEFTIDPVTDCCIEEINASFNPVEHPKHVERNKTQIIDEIIKEIKEKY
jgi:hypothetical protein